MRAGPLGRGKQLIKEADSVLLRRYAEKNSLDRTHLCGFSENGAQKEELNPRQDH